MARKKIKKQVIEKIKIKRKPKYLQALESIAEAKGYLTPNMVVRSASSVDSPLHNYFEWDDTEAAEKYRIYQARVLLTSVKIEIMGNKQDAFYNAVVTINKLPVRGYFTAERALSDKAISKQILSFATRELEYWNNKYQSIQELSGLVNVQKLKRLKSKLK